MLQMMKYMKKWWWQWTNQFLLQKNSNHKNNNKVIIIKKIVKNKFNTNVSLIIVRMMMREKITQNTCNMYVDTDRAKLSYSRRNTDLNGARTKQWLECVVWMERYSEQIILHCSSISSCFSCFISGIHQFINQFQLTFISKLHFTVHDDQRGRPSVL